MDTTFDHIGQPLPTPGLAHSVAEPAADPNRGSFEDPFEDQFMPDDQEAPHPVNWNLLSADEAIVQWADLNAWVDWLRVTYGLPATVIPPYWHRHDELVWELSALHTHWLNAYDPDGPPSGPLWWHRDFAEARNRLREWVSTAGCRLDRDRPTRQTAWPGESAAGPAPEVQIVDRYADFVRFVADDVAARRRIEDRVRGALPPRPAM